MRISRVLLTRWNQLIKKERCTGLFKKAEQWKWRRPVYHGLICNSSKSTNISWKPSKYLMQINSILTFKDNNSSIQNWRTALGKKNQFLVLMWPYFLVVRSKESVFGSPTYHLWIIFRMPLVLLRKPTRVGLTYPHYTMCHTRKKTPPNIPAFKGILVGMKGKKGTKKSNHLEKGFWEDGSLSTRFFCLFLF